MVGDDEGHVALLGLASIVVNRTSCVGWMNADLGVCLAVPLQCFFIYFFQSLTADFRHVYTYTCIVYVYHTDVSIVFLLV